MNRLIFDTPYKIVQQPVGQFYPTAIVGTLSPLFNNPLRKEALGYGE